MPAQRLISGFIDELRRHGLSLSPAEQIDASRAVLEVGVESRTRLRVALGATLAKTPEGRARFEEAFDAYFSVPRGGRRQPGARGPAASGRGLGRGRPPGGDPDPGRRGPGRPRDPSRSAAPDRDRRPGPERVLTGGRETGPGRLRKLVTASRRSPARRDERASGRHERPRGGSAQDARRRDLVEPATEPEEAALAGAVASVIREIRLRRGRRYVRGPRGRLWVKRLVRESLGHGGVPFTLPMKERSPRRPRVLVLADVSHSVIRSAGLFLMICRGLRERLGRVAIWLFVDRITEASEEVGRWGAARAAAPARGPRRFRTPGAGVRPHTGAPSFSDIVQSLPQIDPAAPSDYGRVFYQARSGLLRSGGRDTVLVVLGDARSNRRDPLTWAFEEIASRCRRVLWLNPEPRERWDSGDSVMSAYAGSCDVVCEVRDLDSLAAGVREILRSL